MGVYLTGLFFAGVVSLIYGYRWGRRSISHEIFEKAKKEYMEHFTKNFNESMEGIIGQIDEKLKQEIEQLYQERSELLDKIEKINKDKEKEKNK